MKIKNNPRPMRRCTTSLGRFCIPRRVDLVCPSKSCPGGSGGLRCDVAAWCWCMVLVGFFSVSYTYLVVVGI